MRKCLFAVLAAIASGVALAFTPVAYTNSFTRDGVTYVQRGALGTKEYVVTNVDAQTVGRVQSVNGKTGTVVLGASDVGALPDNQAQLEANTNFKNAVEAVSPPVVLPEKWALANVTNASGQAVSASDVNALPSGTTHVSGDVPTSRKVNGKQLNADITLSATDVGAVPSSSLNSSIDTRMNDRWLTDDFPADMMIGVRYAASAQLVQNKSVLKNSGDYLSAAFVSSGNQSLTLQYGDGTEVSFEPSFSAPVTSVNGYQGAVFLSASDVSAIPSSKLTSGMTWASGSSNWMNGSLIVGNTGTLQLNNTAKVWFINPDYVKVGSALSYTAATKLKDWMNANETDATVASWAKAGQPKPEMDYEAMTNTVNEVKAKFYDQPLQVEWTVRMVNGDMKLYATTNVNTSVLNN